MNKKAKQGSMGFVSILTLIFIGLKLFKIVSWSWVWVLSPAWIYALTLLALLGVALVARKINEKNG